MNTIPTPDGRPVIAVSAWTDPNIDIDDHPPRSNYVEMFWLPVIGPTASWLLRRLTAAVRTNPDGVEVDLDVLARSMGLANRPGSPFDRGLERLVRFGLAHHTAYGLAVRTRIPVLAARHVRRLPDDLRVAHDTRRNAVASLADLERAHALAAALVAAGVEHGDIEERLDAIGIPTTTAVEAATVHLEQVAP